MHDQADSLRRQLAKVESGSLGAKTIAIVSGKGGVGKSNVAINFSLALIKQQKKVLIFDLDVGMGNIDILLGQQSKHHIGQLFTHNISLRELIEIGPGNLHYVAGGSGLEHLFTMSDIQKEYFFAQYMSLIDRYDYIIFDMGAGATRESLSFILASDECIVVTTPEPTALTDAYGMVKHIINNTHEMSINIIMNRAQSKRSGHKALEGFREVALRFLQIDIRLLGILPDDRAVLDAVMSQTPFLLFKENSSISNAIKEIAINYLSRSQKLSLTPEKPGSFIARLKQLLTKR